MPTYEYRCKECGCVFERIKRISDPPVDVCPECGGEAERLISGGAGLLFKGSGFYTTDYRPESYKKAAAADSSGVKDSKPGKKSDAEKSKSPKADKKSKSSSKGSD